MGIDVRSPVSRAMAGAGVVASNTLILFEHLGGRASALCPEKSDQFLKIFQNRLLIAARFDVADRELFDLP